ncbi:hypothetical protein GOBAR_AA10526 [Gossypium barbadense]|uniref:Uncharacterized protein n=1 Tax=Gossypium barbadense TaxID=3634 RepID=A0A2P5Y3H4_GOSBA|nr:hypothetical protein GOBAR_AA10526 [Gossypium barbadense]
MDESKRAVPTSKGQALADEYGVKFFETKPCQAKCKDKSKCGGSFLSRAKDIKQRLADSDTKAEPSTIKINQPDPAGIAGQAAQKSGCCN